MAWRESHFFASLAAFASWDAERLDGSSFLGVEHPRRSTRKEHINTVRVSCSIQPRQTVLPKDENGGLLPEPVVDAPPAHCLSQHLQRVIPWCPSEEGTGPVEECPGQVFCLFSLKRSHREVHTGTAEAVHGDPHTNPTRTQHTHQDKDTHISTRIQRFFID